MFTDATVVAVVQGRETGTFAKNRRNGQNFARAAMAARSQTPFERKPSEKYGFEI